MAVTYGNLLAGVVTLESRTGGDQFKMGVQGIVPRPRFNSPGFGRLEGIFPRVFMNGGTPSGRVHYFTAAEYDYERIPVPGVTQGRGPDVVESSATIFARVDVKVGQRQSTTFETLVFPSWTRAQGLSPRRDQGATADLASQDVFAGITHRIVAGEGSVFTLQVGTLAHQTTLSPNGTGIAVVSPTGWHENWFSGATRNAVRTTVVATWERLKTIAGRAHDFTVTAELGARRLHGRVAENAIRVETLEGQVVRNVTFGDPSSVRAGDFPLAAALRDLWQVTRRLQVDAGLRVDHSRYGGSAGSARAGLRYALDDAGATVLKAGYGRFVMPLPLSVPAFAGYPTRLDRWFDADTGELTHEVASRPTVGELRLPRSSSATFSIERQLTASMDGQIVVTDRESSNLATLRVPSVSGPLTVESTGASRYRELQLSVRKTWPDDQQVFVSYVRSTGRGELNDFTSLFGQLDAALLQPGAVSRLSTDARDRVIAWGTVNLPRRVVISPVAEWRSGFPYSVLDQRYVYDGTPNSHVFPSFFATDLVVYKTVTVKKRSADLGVQLFNLTNHRNPRDVYAVSGSPHFGTFANSVGTIVRGYMLVKW
jgi:hypothetical protein